MAFLDRFRKQQPGTGPEARALDPSAIPRNSEEYGGNASGVWVSDLRAMQSVAVSACVQVLADSIAALPLDGYRKQGGLRVEMDPPPPLVRETFGPELSHFEGFDQIVRPLAMRGESLCLISGLDYLEHPSRLTPIHPDDWWVRREGKFDELVYKINGVDFGAAEVKHIKRYSMPGQLHAISPIANAAQSIGISLAAERYGATYFRDAANPSAVLESDQDMTDDQIGLTQRTWLESHGGRRRPAVMTGGLKYRAISISPNESQFLETRKFQRGEIAMMFRIPPHMIGDTERSTSWGTGIEQQSIGFVRYTLRPWLVCIEQALSSLLPRGQYVRFNVDALLRGDTKAQAESFLLARNGGWLNVNEIRSYYDRAPVEGGDSYIQPLNMGPLGSDPLASKGESDGPQE